MINEEYRNEIVDVPWETGELNGYSSMFDSKIDRLQSTLKGRLNLLNMVKKLIEKNYVPLTLENIKIDIESESDIINFIIKNNDYMDSFLIGCMEEWFLKNGTKWQKNRISKYFKK